MTQATNIDRYIIGAIRFTLALRCSFSPEALRFIARSLFSIFIIQHCVQALSLSLFLSALAREPTNAIRGKIDEKNAGSPLEPAMENEKKRRSKGKDAWKWGKLQLYILRSYVRSGVSASGPCFILQATHATCARRWFPFVPRENERVENASAFHSTSGIPTESSPPLVLFLENERTKKKRAHSMGIHFFCSSTQLQSIFHSIYLLYSFFFFLSRTKVNC